MASQQVSGILASELITEARSYVNEPVPVFWNDTEFLRWLNDGTVYIVAQTHSLESVETEELIENTLSYALIAPFIAIKAVVYNQGSGVEKGLIHGNLQSIGHVHAAGEPIYWDQSEDNVIVYPKPDGDHSGVGHDIDVYTVTRTSDVLVGAAVLVPACYDKALLFYMVAQAWYKDGKFAKAGRFMAECMAEMNRYRMDFVTIPKEPVDIVK